MIFDDPLAGRSMAKGVRHISMGVAVTSYIVTAVHLVIDDPFYAPEFLTVWMITLAVPLVTGMWSAFRRRDPLRHLQAFILLCYTLELMHPWALKQPPGSLDYAPLMHITISSMILTAVVFKPPYGIPLTIMGNVLRGIERTQAVGWVQAVGETAGTLPATLVPFLVFASIRGELDRLASATAAALDAKLRAAASVRSSLLRQRWDGLIHDKVLAALTCASRGEVEDASVLAADALKALAPQQPLTEPQPANSPTIIAEHAASLGLTLSMHAESWPDGPVGDALRAATCEALTNVQRHAQVDRARVETLVNEGMFTVEVTDQGVGFDPDNIPSRRLGVRERIIGSLAAVGANVSIVSGPGGTRIRMSVRLTDTNAPPALEYRPTAYTLILPLVTGVLASHIIVGAMYLHEGVSLWVGVMGMVMIPLLTLLVALVPSESRAWYPSLALTALVWAALIVNVTDPSVQDWRLWFIGAFNPVLALVSYRQCATQSVGLIAVSLSLGIVGLSLRGETEFRTLVLTTVQCVLWAVAIGWLRRVADTAASQTAQQLAAKRAADARAAETITLENDIAARRRGLDAEVIPKLRDIANQTPLSAREQRQCALLEASTRDQLVAHALLTPELVTAIGDARERGARVIITGDSKADADKTTFRAVCQWVLGLCQKGDRATLRWAPDGHGVLGTAVLMSRHLPADLRVPYWGLTQVSTDDETVLVEVRANLPFFQTPKRGDT